MRGLRTTALIASCVVAAQPSAASARPDAVQRLHLPAQSLRATLQELAQRYQVELLFSSDAIGATQAQALAGTYRIEQALAAALVGSGFDVRRSAAGGFIVVRTVAAPGDPPEAPVPEIVVIGRRTQNADIRRFTNDVQPYQVITRQNIRNAHAASVEELIGKRMSADARGLSMSQMPVSSQASPQSTIDLRGLGSDETLVLIDGRRMPRLPGQLKFVQSDLNGLSPESIDRVEVATSTAGGIYGPGAIAGVVNLVLQRDYRGAEVAVTGGVSARGDAPYGRVDARIGFTPDHGATDVMLAYSQSSSRGLRVGERDYSQSVAGRLFATDVEAYWYGDLPASNSLNVASSDRSPLTLKAAFGGGALGSFFTSLPAGDGRSAAQVGALLRADAGHVDTTPANTASGGRASLTAGHEASSLLANIRHRIGGVELYGDFIRLIDKGAIVTQGTPGITELAASDPRNPFMQAIDINFPTGALSTLIRQRIVTMRGSVGAVAPLPAGWKANLDLSFGSARQERVKSGTTLNADGYLALLGFPSPGGAVLNPFGDSSALHAALASYTIPLTGGMTQTNAMRDFSLRLAGPVATLRGGALFVTLLAEQRRESVAPSIASDQLYSFPIATPQRGYDERVRSGYVELRAPVLPEHGGFVLLRGLELQLAARVDWTRATASPDAADNPSVVYARFTGAERAAIVYTAGLKLHPIAALLIRASAATGETAPPLDQLAGLRLIGLDFPDPRRGNTILRSGSYALTVFKDPLVPERAQTLSAGFIATPFGRSGPTFSLDYARIRRSHEASGMGGDVFTFLYHESLYPDRVTRQPLTAADAAKGYTGGVVTAIDASYTTIGWTHIDAIDGRLDVPLHTARHGALNLFAAGTWQPHFTRFVDPASAPEELTNRSDGVLALRGNAGLDWKKGALGLGLTTQFYGSYSVAGGMAPSDSLNLRYITLQGSERIPAAVTVDLSAEYRVPLERGGARPRTLDIRFGIQDLFDRRPATVINAEGGYSFYADPRRRRFELTLAAGF